MTKELGRLEDLPRDYRDALRKQNLVPLWRKRTASTLPGEPGRRDQRVLADGALTSSMY